MLLQVYLSLTGTGGASDVAAPGSGIGLGALAADREALNVAESPVGADFF